MELSLKTKNLIVGAVVALLTGISFSLGDELAAVVALIAQIGLYSAIMVSRFSLWQLLVPIVSYGIGFLLTDDPIVSAFALLYVPVSVVVTLCLRKNLSRSATVVLSALTVGAVAVGSVVAGVYLAGETISAKGINNFISATGDRLAATLLANVPDSLFADAVSKQAYIRSIVESLKYFSISFVVLFCNIIAFTATAVTKRTVLYLEDGKGRLSARIKEWLFVLSKPSAAMFLICYLCLLIGGETLTFPQQIAFNTVMTAIQGGVFVMAFRVLCQRFRVGGFPSISIYVIIAIFFGLPVIATVLSIMGVFAAFKQKSKEDNKKCKN